ncbi:MAG: class I SAM-dependent RNA methyltransferase [Clostridia bacterium]|nr:class I SAM-dependent RNA methyltransferase [Clostridia bacterium]
MKLNFVCPCLMGVEKLVSQELSDMGAENVKAENGRVLFSGDFSTMARANIRVRYGERILILLSRFKAKTFDELFEGVKAINWHDFIGLKDCFPVKGRTINSKLFSIPDCQSIIKKAIVEKLKTKYRTSWFEETGSTYQIQFLILKDEVSIMIDTTGEPLYKRGYKRNVTKAPIRETLAAAMVKLAHIRYNSLLIDPFCGSGTILIEACLYELNVAPGLRRSFACEDWKIIPKDVFSKERTKAVNEIRRDSEFTAIGYDCDPKVIEIAKENAKIAGVASKIKFETRDVRDFSLNTDHRPISIICNPPYGERMLDIEKARDIYRIISKKFPISNGINYYIITPDSNFEEIFGRVADKKRKLYNGMIKCYYHMYFKNNK